MLKTRILTALVLLPLMLAALFTFPPVVWAVFSGLCIGIALWEFARMAGMDLVTQVAYLVVTALVALFAGLKHLDLPYWVHVLVLVFWLVAVPLWLWRRAPVPAGWGAWYLGWMLMLPAWFAMLEWRAHADQRDALQLLAIMGLVWVADVAAYFSGKAFGRHKLAPAISPGKTLEGVLGAILAVGLYVLMASRLGWIERPFANGQLLVLSVVLTLVSVLGDLLESWCKRCASMKDSSNLLPGHGGVFDRIDSLIAVLAVSNALRVLSGW